MTSARAWPAIFALTFTAISSCNECRGSREPSSAHPSTERGATQDTPKDELGVSPVLVTEVSRLLLAGPVDAKNRYSSTVLVYVRINEQIKRCSGVLIDQGVLLTAGHCVCAPRSDSALIDAAHCAQQASIKTLSYTPVEGMTDGVSSTSDLYSGTVQPHPGLKVLLDDQGGVMSSQADLALIELKTPLERTTPKVLMAKNDVQSSETVVIVGQGYDELEEAYDDSRRFSQNTVTRTPTSTDARFFVRQPEGHTYKGDSGGPCLRETTAGPELIGISSRNLGTQAACTSLHIYRPWLDKQLLRTRRGKSR